MSLAVALTCAVLSTVPVTLQQAREQGRTNTRALIAELNRVQAQAAVVGARSALLPQVMATTGVGAQYVGPQTFIQTVPVVSSTGVTTWQQSPIDVVASGRGSFLLGLQVNQLLYDAGRWATLAQAGAQVDAARGQEDEERGTSELEAIRRFYDLFKAQRSKDVLVQRVTSSEQLLERAKALFQAGRMHKEEEIAAAVNLGNDRIAVLRQAAIIADAQANLSAWLARSPEEELQAVDPGTLTGDGRMSPSYEQSLARARAQRPLLRATEAQVRAARSAVTAAGAGYLPTLSAFGRYDRNGASFAPYFTDPFRQNSVSGGISLNWTAFNGFLTQSQVTQARTGLSSSELTFQQTERDVAAELRRELADLQALVQIAAVSKSNWVLAQDGLTLASSRFEAGDTSTLQVRDAQDKLTAAELNLLDSRVDVEVARAALERSMGTLGAMP